MRGWGFVACLVALGSATSAVAGELRRAIPDDNLAYPVHAVILDGDDSSGSGFYLNTDTEVFFVTAAHVIFDIETLTKLRGKRLRLSSWPKDPTEQNRNIVEVDLSTVQANGDLRKHATHDVAVVRVGSGAQRLTFFPGVTLVTKAESGILCVDVDFTLAFADVLVANDVYLLGYPTSLGLKKIPQIDFDRPLLRKGIVAGLNAKTKGIVLDCPSYGGNSGGPVLQISGEGLGYRLRVIGVMRQFVPYTEVWENKAQKYSVGILLNSGYSVAEPMDAVWTLVNYVPQPSSSPSPVPSP